MSKHIETTAKNLKQGQHFWLAKKLYLATAVIPTNTGITVTTGHSTLLLRNDTAIIIKEF